MKAVTLDPRLWSSLDSFEGVPDYFEPRPAKAARHPAWVAAHDLLAWVGTVLPGIGLAVALAFGGQVLADWTGTRVLHFAKSPLSPIMVAVVLGLLIRNTVGVPAVYEQGLRLCIRTVLRLGIVLLGLQLSVLAVGQLGVMGLPVILCCIATALLAVTWVNRLLGLPKRLGTLIAVGTSICGVSAIAATAPVIDAEDDETSYAIGCITLFGLLALFTYPFIAHALFHANPAYAGIFLGTAIHDTSQVAGAGLMYQQQYAAPDAMKAALVVKLVRNLCMSVLIPLMAVLYRRGERADKAKVRQKWHQVVPLFVVGFVAMACVRSLVDAKVGPFQHVHAEGWKHLLDQAQTTATWFLATAMAAVGLGTGLAKLRGLGYKPLSVGFAAAVLVGGVSVLLIKVLGSIKAWHPG